MNSLLFLEKSEDGWTPQLPPLTAGSGSHSSESPAGCVPWRCTRRRCSSLTWSRRTPVRAAWATAGSSRPWAPWRNSLRILRTRSSSLKRRGQKMQENGRKVDRWFFEELKVDQKLSLAGQGNRSFICPRCWGVQAVSRCPGWHVPRSNLPLFPYNRGWSSTQ